MQLDYRCYVHFRDTAAFDRALDLLTVRTTAGAFSFRKHSRNVLIETAAF